MHTNQHVAMLQSPKWWSFFCTVTTMILSEEAVSGVHLHSGSHSGSHLHSGVNSASHLHSRGRVGVHSGSYLRSESHLQAASHQRGESHLYESHHGKHKEKFWGLIYDGEPNKSTPKCFIFISFTFFILSIQLLSPF
eukprot:GHVN01026257.1.p1 GENE.GHVN01026257.1~~GHVN01026257.1.p1  ORF type:complete len:137 (-),score=14.95 GHVN01026257.1:350-760(-)